MTGSISDLTDMMALQLKKWRLSALELADQAQEQNQFLTFNAINLNEEFRTKGYEHLWLQCEGLQIGQQLFMTADRGVDPAVDRFGDVFAHHLTIERFAHAMQALKLEFGVLGGDRLNDGNGMGVMGRELGIQILPVGEQFPRAGDIGNVG